MSVREMTARMRAELEVLDACADQQEKLAAAKRAYQQDPSPETREALDAAMAEMREFRAWLRAGAKPAQGQQRPSGRVRRGVR